MEGATTLMPTSTGAYTFIKENMEDSIITMHWKHLIEYAFAIVVIFLIFYHWWERLETH